MAEQYVREDQADIRVTVDGVAYGQSWYSAEGGGLEADDGKTRPGAMGREVALGGPASRDDVKVTIQLSDVTIPWIGPLESRVGNSPMKVALTYLKNDRTPHGGRTRVGVLKGLDYPDVDPDSGDPAYLELTMSCNEQAA